MVKVFVLYGSIFTSGIIPNRVDKGYPTRQLFEVQFERERIR